MKGITDIHKKETSKVFCVCAAHFEIHSILTLDFLGAWYRLVVYFPNVVQKDRNLIGIFL